MLGEGSRTKKQKGKGINLLVPSDPRNVYRDATQGEGGLTGERFKLIEGLFQSVMQRVVLFESMNVNANANARNRKKKKVEVEVDCEWVFWGFGNFKLGLRQSSARASARLRV